MATAAALPQKLIEIQQAIQAESNEIKKIEVEYNKVVTGKRSLVEKKTENEQVQSEFKLVEDGATIYKLVGPIMQKVDLGEAKTNVKTRLDYIQKEVDRMDHLEKEFLVKVEEKKKLIMKHQAEFKGEMMKMQQQANAQTQQQ